MALNTMIIIKSSITKRWHDIIRPTLKQILLDSKPRKENLVLTHSSILIARVNIRQIATVVHSKSINSTESDMLRSLKS